MNVILEAKEDVHNNAPIPSAVISAPVTPLDIY